VEKMVAPVGRFFVLVSIFSRDKDNKAAVKGGLVACCA